MAKRKAAKRTRIDIKVGGARFVRRRSEGTFKESDQSKATRGQGDRGDR